MTVGAAFALFVISIALLGMGIVGSEFMTPIDRGQFTVALEMPERTTLEENNRIVLQIEKDLSARHEVNKVYTKVGYDSTSGTSNYKTTISVGLVPKGDRKMSSVAVGLDVEKKYQENPRRQGNGHAVRTHRRRLLVSRAVHRARSELPRKITRSRMSGPRSCAASREQAR